jgi:hypothetical protein
MQDKNSTALIIFFTRQMLHAQILECQRDNWRDVLPTILPTAYAGGMHTELVSKRFTA